MIMLPVFSVVPVALKCHLAFLTRSIASVIASDLNFIFGVSSHIFGFYESGAVCATGCECEVIL